MDLASCSGCRVCELACSVGRYNVFSPERSRIRVTREEPGIDIPVFCFQCRNTPCAAVCPIGAITNPEGIVKVNGQTCTGCGLCVEACPYGAMTIDPVSSVAINCDLCDGNPKCVAWCPIQIIRYNSYNHIAQQKRLATAKKLARSTLGWLRYVSEEEAK